MLSWSEQEIAWYLVAERHTDYFSRVAQEIAGMLPSGARLHDLGCGIGSLALPLARLGYGVTAVDNNPGATAVVVRRAVAQGLPVTALTDDYATLPGPVEYPVFCLCGDPTVDLPLLRRWQSKSAVVVTPDAQMLGFRQQPRPRRAVSSAQVEAFLEAEGIAHQRVSLATDFDQPLHSREDGLAFLAHHNPELDGTALEELLQAWALPTPESDCPLRLPARKHVTLFNFTP